ncbi:type I methionyl aminopeptidase [Patescibacteria group bacterium]|nr:type I methionyl aminopeptidase [Patescibacteria group bacterium]
MSKITIKTAQEIAKLKEGGKVLATIIEGLTRAVMPGITTKQLEDLARKLMDDFGVKPSFLNFGDPPYPAAVCISLNEGVVHCVPSSRKIEEGDILGIDAGIWYEGLCTDMARTVGVGKISKQAEKLMAVASKALEIAKSQIKPGATIGDMGYAVQTYVEKNGFSVVRQLVGHGVGYKVHEAPRIPNYGQKGEGEALKEGMVLALEPMVNVGEPEVEVKENKWDIVTKDRKFSAHFEDTVVVTKTGCEVLTIK